MSSTISYTLLTRYGASSNAARVSTLLATSAWAKGLADALYTEFPTRGLFAITALRDGVRTTYLVDAGKIVAAHEKNTSSPLFAAMSVLMKDKKVAEAIRSVDPKAHDQALEAFYMAEISMGDQS